MKDQLPNIYQWQHTWEGALWFCILQYVLNKITYYSNLCLAPGRQEKSYGRMREWHASDECKEQRF